MYEGMHLDEEQVFRKAKLLLGIYRDVVWASMKEVEYIRDVCDSYYSNHLSTALTFLNDFAPTERKEEFKHKVSGIFETKWMIDLIDTAMLKIYNYHGNGSLYHEILCKCYINAYHMTESEILELLCMERANFYTKKKEAIKLFGVALWGYALPKYQSAFAQCSKNQSYPDDFYEYTQCCRPIAD